VVCVVGVCVWEVSGGLVVPLALGKAGSLLGVGWVVSVWLVAPLAFVMAGSFLGLRVGSVGGGEWIEGS